MLVSDMRAKGATVEMPGDPMADPAFIGQLTEFYAMAPSRYPAEAPLEVVGR
jgi:hypothetical protein